MKRIRLVLLALALALPAACASEATAPRADECPVMGGGSGTCY